VTVAMAPPDRLTIAHARARDRRVLVVRGTIDLETAPVLIAALSRAAGARDPLALDLRDVDLGEEGGTALLVNAVRRLRHRRDDVVVLCPPGALRTALERAGLARRIEVLDDPAALEDAAALDGHPLEPDPGTVEPAAVGGHRQRLSTPARRGTLLAEATLVMEARHADPTLCLDDVAREIATSSRQLQRVFSELAGRAFRDELAAVRMQHGAELLMTTDLPVAEIARRVGYRQAAQFAKAFRRHHGVSPSGLRRAVD
jgi:AraC family transcriptional regulator, regulatory protein of adaptative response / methylphosphotriester-DNA alkyltransferase methyltransferase